MLNQYLMLTCCCFELSPRHTKIANGTKHTHGCTWQDVTHTCTAALL